MARGSATANNAATSAQNLSNTYAGNAANIFGPLAGTLESDIAHPPGIDPTTMAQMDTAAMQTAGGANAGAVGQGALKAARTRNIGGSDAAIQESGREAGRTLSRGVLANRLRSSELADQQRRSAIGGLQGLYNTNVSGGNQALGIVPSAVNANTNATNASWDWASQLFNPIMRDLSYKSGGFTI